MKAIKHLLFLLFPLVSLSALDYSEYARLLETYAKPNGVDYQSWFEHKEDLKALDAFLELSAKADVSAMSRDERMAFYINLYNAGMIQAVFQNYPLDTVSTLGPKPFSIFSKKFIKQGDRLLSLDDVEKGILLKNYFDPRIHWAVNCASESCPPLRGEPFVGDRLEAQLQEQTLLFAESNRAARIDHKSKTVAYSELFSWYDADFEGDHPAQYLNQYRNNPIPLSYKIDWITYDWALNAAK